MYSLRFSAYRLVEFPNAALFQAQVGRWLEGREAENNYLLGRLPWLAEQASRGLRAGSVFLL